MEKIFKAIEDALAEAEMQFKDNKREKFKL